MSASIGSARADAAGLAAEVTLGRGAFTLEAALTVAAGETLALLGPNGAGKSTLLACLAGLLAPDAGVVTLDGRTLTRCGDPSAPAVRVPPERRRVGLLGQDPLLFPHLSALENVAYGVRSRGVSAAAARGQARAWLDTVGLGEHADRRPRRLSGGQQQRVALARALAARPALLLLDEPMAALDVQTVPRMRALLAERVAQAGVPCILVTHDADDARALARRCLVLEHGRVVDAGPTGRVLSRPRSDFAAALGGSGLVDRAALRRAVTLRRPPRRPASRR